MKLNAAVKQLRAVTNDTQQSLASRLGLSIRAIANYEKDRVPHSAVLLRLAKLAQHVGREDLAEVFQAGLSTELKEVLEPMTAEERVWSEAVLTLLRNRDRVDWPRAAHDIIRALETLLPQKHERDPNELARILVEARYSLANKAERELDRLTNMRQADTGETYYEAYSQVLIQSPMLYAQYLEERAAAARGTPFEGTMARAEAKPNKGRKSK